MSSFPIVNRKFSADEFDGYMTDVPISSWTKRVVLHNTAAPSIAQRPGGVLKPSHITSLHDYYQWQAPRKGGKGWSGGPHLFIDVDGIWVFNPLDRKGVHSPSFNANAWGIEMLGDFASEAFDSGLGLKIHQNAVRAVAAMMRRLGGTITDENFKLHKEDPATDHDCPGKNVKKADFASEVQGHLSGGTAPTSGTPTKIVVYRAGAGPDPVKVLTGIIRAGVTYADRKQLAQATGLPFTGSGEIALRKFVGSKYRITFDPATDKVYIAEI